MKTRKWPSLLLSMAITVFFISSCQDWGQWDPPAGNQVFPKLQLMGDYVFDTFEESGFELHKYDNGNLPEIVFDEEHGNVLHLNGGYLSTTNPLFGASLQLGGSFTFWMKLSEENQTGTLFSITNEDRSSSLSYGVNGKVDFKSANGNFSSTEELKDVFATDEWYYLAVVFNIDGYAIYVNGEKAINFKSTDFDFTQVRDFLMEASTFYWGNGETLNECWFNDLKVYRNIITAKEIAVPEVKPPTQEDTYQFPPLNTVGYYLLDNSLNNSINSSQSGELITVETQATPSSFIQDPVRGTVWNQMEGWTGHGNGWAYTRLDNPIRGVTLTDEGLTLTLWINPPTINHWDQIFVLNDGTSKFWMNALGYVGYNGVGGWFDCQQDNPANVMPAGEWTMVTLVVTPEAFTVYYNDAVKFTSTENGGYNSGDLTNYQPIIDLFTSAPDFFFGYETFWKAAPAMIDDLLLISRPIPASEVKLLYQDTKRVNGGIVENPTYIPQTAVGYYKLDDTFTNEKNPSLGGELITVEPQATPSSFVKDPVRGTVWNQMEGWTGHANGWAYTRFDNPMRGAVLTDDGLTLTLWINPPTINHWDQIFVLNDGTSKFWMNALGYVGYNGAGGWFDCQQDNPANVMPAGEWTMVTLVVTPEAFTVYYNDAVKFTSTENGGYNSGDLTNYQPIIDLFTSAPDFFFGYETFWKAAPAMIDDVVLCSSPLTEKQVKALYNGTKK